MQTRFLSGLLAVLLIGAGLLAVSGSVRIEGWDLRIGKGQALSARVPVPEAVPYRVRTELHPARLFVDFKSESVSAFDRDSIAAAGFGAPRIGLARARLEPACVRS